MRTSKAYRPAKARIPFGGNDVARNLAHQNNDDAAEGATLVRFTRIGDYDGVACYAAFESIRVSLTLSGNPE